LSESLGNRRWRILARRKDVVSNRGKHNYYQHTPDQSQGHRRTRDNRPRLICTTQEDRPGESECSDCDKDITDDGGKNANDNVADCLSGIPEVENQNDAEPDVEDSRLEKENREH